MSHPKARLPQSEFLASQPAYHLCKPGLMRKQDRLPSKPCGQQCSDSYNKTEPAMGLCANDAETRRPSIISKARITVEIPKLRTHWLAYDPYAHLVSNSEEYKFARMLLLSSCALRKFLVETSKNGRRACAPGMSVYTPQRERH